MLPTLDMLNFTGLLKLSRTTTRKAGEKKQELEVVWLKSKKRSSEHVFSSNIKIYSLSLSPRGTEESAAGSDSMPQIQC